MPISVITPKQACTLCYSDRSIKVLSFYKDFIKTVNKKYYIPAVVVTRSNRSLHQTRKRTSKRILYQRDKGRCVYCSCHLKFKDATIDHIIPKSKGGTNSWNNLVISCFSCNNKKTDMTLEEFGHTNVHVRKPSFIDIHGMPEEWENFLQIYI